MADTSDFRNGLIIRFKNDPYVIVEFQHVKPGKGGAFVRTTLKSLKTGRNLDNTFRSGESVDVIRVERRKYQFLYKDGDMLVIMDNENYEQLNVEAALFGGGEDFLKEGETVELVLDDKEKIISAEVPIFVQLKVIETEPGFKGDTATNVMKPATLETGAKINVPLFVNEGELLKVDTRTYSYVERIKN
ncbi:elongation factor P [bacterium BRH_c32]|nr:MAG: elongation factor P [bacterium BRH_c32]